jgi:decaprenylphospho-beta-D-ribofuranose 2-oxidase
VNTYQFNISHPIANDQGNLLPTMVKSIRPAHGQDQLQKIIREANKTNDKISIAGMQHSQGGQTYYPNSIMLDMKTYNKILHFDPHRDNYRSKRCYMGSDSTKDKPFWSIN